MNGLQLFAGLKDVVTQPHRSVSFKGWSTGEVACPIEVRINQHREESSVFRIHVFVGCMRAWSRRCVHVYPVLLEGGGGGGGENTVCKSARLWFKLLNPHLEPLFLKQLIEQ